MGVRRRAWVEVRELRGDRLAEDDRARRAQPSDCWALGHREFLRWHRGARARREAIDGVDVLHADEDAEQRRSRRRVWVARDQRAGLLNDPRTPTWLW